MSKIAPQDSMQLKEPFTHELYTACPDCDLLLRKSSLKSGERARCPRCGAVLDHRVKNSIQRTLAVVVAGLLSFIPAISLPLLGLEAAGMSNQASLLQCIEILFDSQLYLVTFLLVLFCIVAPILKLSIAFLLLLRIQRKQRSPLGLRLFRYYQQWGEWGMLDVFMLGMIVSLYKILGLAHAVYGLGLASFVLLLLSSVLMDQFLDEELVWERLHGQS